jgi:hypothetical protein
MWEPRHLTTTWASMACYRYHMVFISMFLGTHGKTTSITNPFYIFFKLITLPLSGSFMKLYTLITISILWLGTTLFSHYDYFMLPSHSHWIRNPSQWGQYYCYHIHTQKSLHIHCLINWNPLTPTIYTNAIVTFNLLHSSHPCQDIMFNVTVTAVSYNKKWLTSMCPRFRHLHLNCHFISENTSHMYVHRHVIFNCVYKLFTRLFHSAVDPK